MTIRSTSLRVKLPLDLVLDPGITINSLRAWISLTEQSMSVSQFSDEMHYSKDTARRILDSLVAIGWATKVKIPNGSGIGNDKFLYSSLIIKS